MRIPLVLRAAILALTLVCWLAAPAFAAPTVLSSDPEEGAEMHEPPGDVTVEFSEPLQASSGLTVTDGCGNEVSEGKARIVGNAMNELNVIIGEAPYKGTYTVDYVGTGVTGTTSGSFDFVVHGGTDCDGTGGGHHGGSGGGHGGGNGGGGNHSGGNSGGNHSGGHNSGSTGGHNSGGTGGHKSGSGNHSGTHTMSGGNTMSGASHDDSKDHNNMKAGHKGGHKAGHTGGQKTGGGNGAGGPIAAPPTIPIATDIPTGTTVVIALGLAILMGLIGGWVLRVSSPS